MNVGLPNSIVHRRATRGLSEIRIFPTLFLTLGGGDKTIATRLSAIMLVCGQDNLWYRGLPQNVEFQCSSLCSLYTAHLVPGSGAGEDVPAQVDR